MYIPSKKRDDVRPINFIYDTYLYTKTSSGIWVGKIITDVKLIFKYIHYK